MAQVNQTPQLKEPRYRVWNVLNRPFVVVFLGGLAVAYLTHQWQTDQREREAVLAYEQAIAAEQIDLLGELPSAFEMSVGALNDRFTRLLSIATVTLRNGDPAKLEGMKTEMRELEKSYRNAVPLDGPLNVVVSLSRCESVTRVAIDLMKLWDDFREYFQSLNRQWNTKQNLDPVEIRSAQDFRAKAVDDMNRLVLELLTKMGLEVKAARESRVCH